MRRSRIVKRFMLDRRLPSVIRQAWQMSRHATHGRFARQIARHRLKFSAFATHALARLRWRALCAGDRSLAFTIRKLSIHHFTLQKEYRAFLGMAFGVSS